MNRKDLFKKVFEYFSLHQPEATTELVYQNPFQLLVAVILSAQCTDKRINQVTPALFGQFPNPEAMADASEKEIFALIRSVSYPNSKSKYLKSMARMLVEEFKGRIPSKPEDLIKLPGVGRKTANVISSVIYDKPAMAVDTHVFRVSARLGLTRNAKTPYQAEMQLIRYLPEDKISIAHHWLILHGRYICTARNPKCMECGLVSFCQYKAKHVLNKLPHKNTV